MAEGRLVKDLEQRLVGRRFGKLVCLKKLDKSRKTGSYHWNRLYQFECDCGALVEAVGTYMIRDMARKSCKNCFVTHNQKPLGVASQNALVGQYRYGAKVRNLAFEISNAQAVSLMQLNCFYCGDAPSKTFPPINTVSRFAKSRERHGNFTYNGLDRLNNSQGYVLGNVVPCCWPCNKFKGSLDYQEFMELILKIYGRLGDENKIYQSSGKDGKCSVHVAFA